MVETKQIFIDGRTRKRDNIASIGEKMKPGEMPFRAAQRALKEELGIEETEKYITKTADFYTEEREPVVSHSYPGLLTKRTLYTLSIYLTENDFRPEGYQEVQEDKTTIFEWREVSTSKSGSV